MKWIEKSKDGEKQWFLYDDVGRVHCHIYETYMGTFGAVDTSEETSVSIGTFISLNYAKKYAKDFFGA